MPTRNAIPISCTVCGLRKQCLPKRLSSESLAVLEASIRRRHYARGTALYREGQPFRQLFILRSGSVRLTSRGKSAVTHVLGFSLPAEILGFDGTAKGYYVSSADALEETDACLLTISDLSSLVQQDPRVAPQVLSMIGADLARAHAHAFLLMQPSPLVRVAAFIDDLAHRYGLLKRSTERLVLPMSRGDIASFTGIAIETVSRSLTRLTNDDILTVAARSIEILDHQRLRLAWEGAGSEQ